MHVIRFEDLEPFTTKDGSTVRELVGPAWTEARNQSLAEATVPPGGETDEHYHVKVEEIYYFVAGAGRMRAWPRRSARWRPANASSSRRGPSTSCGIPVPTRWCLCAAVRPLITTTTR
jgi:hypothetical protein